MGPLGRLSFNIPTIQLVKFEIFTFVLIICYFYTLKLYKNPDFAKKRIEKNSQNTALYIDAPRSL